MRITAPVTAASLCLFAWGSHAVVLDSFAGPFIASEGSGNLLVVDNTADTGDWIDGFDEPTDAGTLYYRFDVNVADNNGETGTGGMFTAVQLFDGGGTNEQLGVGNSWIATDWGFFSGPGDDAEGTLDGPQPIVLGQTETIVVRVDFIADADDDVTIWFNPVEGVGEAGQDPAITTVNETLAAFQFDTVFARGGNGTAEITYSNITFATEFGDLIDSPSFDPADLDTDGDVDDADFGLFFAAFSGPGVPTGNPAADLDGDTDTDDADFGLAFAAFTGPGAAASVPEPASLALLGLGGLALARRWRA